MKWNALLMFLMTLSLNAQDTLGHFQLIQTKWSDSFLEWEIYTSGMREDDDPGTLEPRWASSEDWNAWDFRIGEWSGEINTRWKDKFDQWELDAYGQRVVMKPRWPGDPAEWRITQNNETWIFSVENKRIPEEWEVDYLKEGSFEVYTEYETDRSSWLIYDTNPEITKEARLAMIFIAIFYSTPRY